MKIPKAALAATAALALLLTGCGTTEGPASSATNSASAGPVTVTDSRGVDVKLDGPAKRVVGTEWNVVENLATLGVQPVGVADIKGYNAWVSAGKLDSTATDIGTRGEPSLDAIASLDADLIVATADLPEAVVKQLEDLAPVVVVKSADASRQIDQAKDNLKLVAKATGTEAKADEAVAAFDAAVAKGKEALDKAGLAGSRVAFADGWVADGKVSVRPFVKGSLLTDINTELGLVTPWTMEGDPAYGLASTDVEGLTAIDADSFVYITNSADGDFTEELAGNAVWKSLPFVESGKVHRLSDGIWMFGGPASMTQYVDAVVAALTK
ncbi:iron-siderophore ABC transporter substrate-binding protein [Pseudarthrobacter sulfonivorans]|uniref:iron-siderophore ABC transporter substrate-binding protein n=1 Tax=Pseudarthrobacter sulfonivorans TaxID=121292 RepID=UPI00285A6B41|nr:iron-siderophore ABC transporter substrate-binding protein [Pseudarthrobacter sulfonivorans]MDR6414731.1 iron complex transport system substrate-binding protein [Pseudarthrobacter sulfonivorans]